MLRPKTATLRPFFAATSKTVCIRCRLEPNVATITRPLLSRMNLSKTGTSDFSEGDQPLRSAFTLSEISSFTPASPNCANFEASKARLSIGVWSILKSEV